jgi:1-deoxy-D-xylulose-5-phosphate synthase
MDKYPLLDTIDSPVDLKKLSIHVLPRLCQEIRAFFIDVVSANGGHFAAGLGVVELTVALHYVFNSPDDRLVWDVGHQAYIHKILTGRRQTIWKMRKLGGISGFPKRSESGHDAFGTGHASTAISAALGMAVASQLEGNHLRCHIAIVGDGALTGGLAFEGLNNAGVSQANLLVVLNDNSISIDHAVGALSQSLEIQSIENANLPSPSRGIADGRTKRPKFRQAGHELKATNLAPRDFFESLHLPYYGPAHGHDVVKLVSTLQEMKSLKGPRLLHLRTTKGKGYRPAEQDQILWHATGKFDKLTGNPLSSYQTDSMPPKYQEVFGSTLVELGKSNPKIVGISPAMLSGSSLNFFAGHFPERTFDVGIAEAHALTFAAGLATQGMLPFCAIYSTFLQRAFDQLVHDICLQQLKVILCIDRAGIVGEDGPTHHGVFDIAFLRPVPHLIIASPKDHLELRNLLYTAQLPHVAQAMAIRYPRGAAPPLPWELPFTEIPIGKAQIIRHGHQVAILALGNRVDACLQAVVILKEEYTVVNMRFVKPIDEELLQQLRQGHTHFVVVEDGILSGGMGTAVLEAMQEWKGKKPEVMRLGYPDQFIEHGNTEALYSKYFLDSQGIATKIIEWLCAYSV